MATIQSSSAPKGFGVDSETGQFVKLTSDTIDQPSTAPTPAAPVTPTPTTAPYGTTSTGTRVDATTKEVQQYMQAFPGTNLDVAIGSVVQKMNQLGPTATSGQAFQAMGSQLQQAGATQSAKKIATLTSDQAASDVNKNLSYLSSLTEKTDPKKTLVETTEESMGIAETPEQKAIKELEDQYNKFFTALEERKATLDAQNLAQVEAIQAEYTKKRNEMRTINSNRAKAMEILGTASGRQRYAPTIQKDVIDKEVDAGMKRLEEIDQAERNMIAQAEKAKSDADWELLSASLNAQRELYKEKKDTIQTMFENTMKSEQHAILKANAQRENNKDTLEQLTLIGKTGGTYSPEDLALVDESLGYGKGFSENYMEFVKQEQTAKTDQDIFDAQIKLIGALDKIDPSQSISYKGTTYYGTKEIDPMKGINRNVVKNDVTGEQKEVYTRLNADGVPEIVGEQVINPGIKTPDASTEPKYQALNAAITSMSGLMTDADFKNAKTAINDFILRGDIQGAQDFIKAQVRNTSSATLQEKLDGKADAVQSLNNISKLLDEYTAKNGDTNIFKGKTNEILEKGGLTKDPALSNIANRIAIAIVDYRKAISGSAFTASEKAEFDKIFPSTGKTGELNKIKIESLTDSLNQYENTVIRRTIGDRNYESIFGEQGETSSVPPRIELESITSMTDFLSSTKDSSGTSPYYSWVVELKKDMPDASDQEIFEQMKSTINKLNTSQPSKPQSQFGTFDSVTIDKNTPGLSFNKDLSKSQNSSKIPNTQGVSQEFIKKLAVKNPEGTRGGQCVTFLHTFADFPPIGDLKTEKLRSVDKYGVKKENWQPKVGDIVITTESDKWGHGAMVNAVNPDGTVTLTESNYKGNERVTHNRKLSLQSPKIYGAIIPKSYKV